MLLSSPRFPPTGSRGRSPDIPPRPLRPPPPICRRSHPCSRRRKPRLSRTFRSSRARRTDRTGNSQLRNPPWSKRLRRRRSLVRYVDAALYRGITFVLSAVPSFKRSSITKTRPPDIWGRRVLFFLRGESAINPPQERPGIKNKPKRRETAVKKSGGTGGYALSRRFAAGSIIQRFSQSRKWRFCGRRPPRCRRCPDRSSDTCRCRTAQRLPGPGFPSQ